MGYNFMSATDQRGSSFKKKLILESMLLFNPVGLAPTDHLFFWHHTIFL